MSVDSSSRRITTTDHKVTGYKNMTHIDETLEIEGCPHAWAATATKNVAVNHLMDRICPNYACNDVDRAILGASLGG